MRRLLVTTVLGLALPGMAGAQGFFDDFSSGNDANWTHVDLLDANGLGPTSYDATSGSYVISSVAELPPLPVFAATGAFRTDSIFDPPAYSNGVVRAVLRSNNDETNVGIAARAGGTGDSGYLFFVNSLENSFGIWDIAAGMPLAADGTSIESGADYFIEATFIGDALAMKLWSAEEPEPPQPQVTLTDSRYAVGALGLAIYNQGGVGVGGRLSGTFDDVSFAIPEPGTALLLLCGLVGLRRCAGA